jgi:hypothetical protein
MEPGERWFVRDDGGHGLGLARRHVERDYGTAAIAEDGGLRLAGHPKYGDRIAALLTDGEAVGVVHCAAAVRPPVVRDDLEFVRQPLCHRGIGAAISSSARDHQQRRSLAADLHVQPVAFGRYML